MRCVAIPALSAHEVHIWQANLDLAADEAATLASLLSPDEMQKASRFHFPIHRQRYIAARGLLRLLLGQYLQVPPATITLAYTTKGKPYLPQTNLQFNVSHSENRALLGFTWDYPLGVDIEKVATDYDAAVAARYLSPAEWLALQAEPPATQTEAFYRLWARKEAVIKALGVGISYGLAKFTVPIAPVLREPHYVLEDGSVWHLQSVDVHPEFQAAFVTAQSVQQMLLLQY